MTKFVVTSLLATATLALGIGSAAQAAPLDQHTVSTVVRFGDLDLSSPDGAKAARVRLAKVAQRLCRKLGDTRRASDSATYADCYRETLANAVRQLRVPTTEDKTALLQGVESPITVPKAEP